MEQACDTVPCIRLEVVGEYSRANILDTATREMLVSLGLDLSTRTIQYTDAQGSSFFSFEVAEDGVKLADRRTKAPLFANEAATEFVRRLMKETLSHGLQHR